MIISHVRHVACVSMGIHVLSFIIAISEIYRRKNLLFEQRFTINCGINGNVYTGTYTYGYRTSCQSKWFYYTKLFIFFYLSFFFFRQKGVASFTCTRFTALCLCVLCEVPNQNWISNQQPMDTSIIGLCNRHSIISFRLSWKKNKHQNVIPFS